MVRYKNMVIETSSRLDKQPFIAKQICCCAKYILRSSTYSIFIGRQHSFKLSKTSNEIVLHYEVYIYFEA